MKNDLLLVEDDSGMRKLTRALLVRGGYRVRDVETAEEGLVEIQAAMPRLLISDINLPGISGIRMLQILRGEPKTASLPVILLTVKGDGPDRVQGLQTGADDYVTKPYLPEELLARVKALLRRVEHNGPEEDPVLVLGDLQIDPARRVVSIGNRTVSLRRKEFELLRFFLKHPGKLVTRDTLSKALWNDESIVSDNTLSVHIKHLRDKIGPYGEHLETLIGEGYRFNEVSKRSPNL